MLRIKSVQNSISNVHNYHSADTDREDHSPLCPVLGELLDHSTRVLKRWAIMTIVRVLSLNFLHNRFFVPVSKALYLVKTSTSLRVSALAIPMLTLAATRRIPRSTTKLVESD